MTTAQNDVARSLGIAESEVAAYQDQKVGVIASRLGLDDVRAKQIGALGTAIAVPATMAAPVIAQTAAKSTLTITYVLPADNGAEIQKVIAAVTDTVAGTTKDQDVTDPSPGTLRGLKTATAYTVKVRAVNAVGEGVLSPISNSATTHA